MKSVVTLTFGAIAAISAAAAGANPAATPAPAQEQAPAQAEASTAQAEATPAPAEASTVKAVPKSGDAVYDSAGEAVGTVESVTVDQFVLNTDVGKATLPLASVGHGPKGHTLAVTATELKNAIRNANAGAGASEGGA